MPTFLSSVFPAQDATDGQFLYRSLGSFWTQVFQDKNALKGYTTGMAEELIQSYYNLTEILGNFSVKHATVLHKEKWLPIVIKKSEFNRVPFVFEPNGAVFGIQPSSDPVYGGELFRFGYPKSGNGISTYAVQPSPAIQEVGCIANRIIAPSLVLIPGVDFTLIDGIFQFSVDLFASDYIPRMPLVADMGVPVTYVDDKGNNVPDEFIILWGYNAKLDNNDLQNNFGTLFDLQLPATKESKELLVALFNLTVEGGTISAINSIIASLAGAPITLETKETVEQIYTDTTYKFIITDKHVYRTAISQPLPANVFVSAELSAGTILTTNALVVDTAISPIWWKSEIKTSKLGFASHIFAADCKHQLFFENTISIVTYTGTTLTFPVQGHTEDVKSFQSYINSSDNQQLLLSALNFTPGVAGTYALNPVDFLFDNFLKSSTLLLKLEFSDQNQLQRFFDLYPILQPYMPPHVYVMTYLVFDLQPDTLAGLNSSGMLNGQVVSSDGSLPNGSRPGDPNTDSVYYKDYLNRMFCVGLSPQRNGEPLQADTNLDTIQLNPSVGVGGIQAGTLRTDIPLSLILPGESVPSQPSTREVPTILLLDFTA